VSAREALGGANKWQKSGWINPYSSPKYQFTTTRWPANGLPTSWAGAVKSGSANGMTNARAASDNITNHDLVTK